MGRFEANRRRDIEEPELAKDELLEKLGSSSSLSAGAVSTSYKPSVESELRKRGGSDCALGAKGWTAFEPVEAMELAMPKESSVAFRVSVTNEVTQVRPNGRKRRNYGYHRTAMC